MRDRLLTDRRSILKTFGGLGVLAAAGPAFAQAVFFDDPFSMGVASGEPTADGFVIWTRLAPRPLEIGGGMPSQTLAVSWEVASDERFRTIVAQGEEAARPELGHSIHVEVSGLQPARPYWYRFRVGGERSRPGRAKTLPAVGAAVDRVRFVSGGCQDWESGYYTAWADAARQDDLDFVFHYGDYFYESRGEDTYRTRDGRIGPNVRRYEGQETYSLDDYRRRYAQTNTDLDIQAARAAAPWFTTWDDHEVDNNWVSDRDQDGTPPEVFLLRRAAAFQAWWENAPVRRSMLPRGGVIRMYRRARWGGLLDAHFLDTRQHRSDQVCGDGFGVSCPERSAADAEVLGAEAERWLFSGLNDRRGPRWNLLAQQVMVADLDRRRQDNPEETAPIYNLDSWAGYEAPRRRLLEQCARAGNVVIMTGDEHQNHANECRLGERIAASEFVATSISSGGNGSDQRRGSAEFLARNPQCKFVNDQRGYVLCEVTPDQWRADFRVTESVSRRGADVTTRRSFAVAPNRPGLQEA